MALHFTSQNRIFMNDLVKLLNDDSNWGHDFGIKPQISKKYNRKVVGLGKRMAEAILVYSDIEQMKPFSLGLGLSPSKEWYHSLSATIEIKTNLSDDRLADLADAVIDILKRNVTLNGYVKILPQSFRNLSEETRGNFRGIIDVSAEKFAPTKLI